MSPAATPSTAARPPATRSRVGNGKALLFGIDGRSAQARRFRDLVEALAADMGTETTEGERLQIRNAAALQLHVEDLTARVVRGEVVDGEAVTRAANAASRALSALRRKAGSRKPAGPTLAEYLASKAADAKASAA